jgi:hypothetical protein
LAHCHQKIYRILKSDLFILIQWLVYNLRWIYCGKQYNKTNFMITDGKPSCVRKKRILLYE